MNSERNYGNEYIEHCLSIIESIRSTQLHNIKEAAIRCANSIASSGVVHLFGSGHSRISCEEMYPRYGSFAGFHLIAELSLTNHTQVVGANGQRQARFLEDINGFGDVILDNYYIAEPDTLIIFSYSGASAVTVDVAIGAKLKRIPVIAIISVNQCKAIPSTHRDGTKLIDVADTIIDLCTPPGDAIQQIDGLDDLVGPTSTIASTVIANTLKCEIAAELVRQGKPPTIFVNRYFGEEVSKQKISKSYDEYRISLIRALGGQPT
jgi:uncharacterized phosphosugar-binding protein